MNPTQTTPSPPDVYISTISSPQNLIDQMHEKSNCFYQKEVKEKELGILKELADQTKARMYGTLRFFLSNRTMGSEPNIPQLIKILEAIRNLKFLYQEMEKQESRKSVKILRWVGANPKTTAIATTATICIAGYTAVAFDIDDDFNNRTLKYVVIVSAVIGVVVGVLGTIVFNSLEKKYHKVKINEWDIAERALFSKYFKNFGEMDFDGCINIIKELDFIDAVKFPADCLEGLEQLAIDSKIFKEHSSAKANAEKFRSLDGQQQSSFTLRNHSFTHTRTSLFPPFVQRKQADIENSSSSSSRKREYYPSDEERIETDSSEEQKYGIENEFRDEWKGDYLSQQSSFTFGGSDDED